MKLLFCTQSDSLPMFAAVRGALAARIPVERCGFIVADSRAYERWIDRNPDFERHGDLILKEWELTSQRHLPIDLARLARYEKAWGGRAGLFGSIVADRRLLMGPNCTYTQDYRRRFSDEELLSILQAGITAVEAALDELRPEAVVGFICVTMLEYLAYLAASARGIRYLNLRPTRIADRVAFGSTLNDPTPEFLAAYADARAGRSPHAAEAREYVARVRSRHGRYEGVVGPSAAPALKVNTERQPIWTAGWRTLRGYARYRTSIAARDNHVPDPVKALAYAAVLNPLRARRVARALGHRYVTPATLTGRRYIFYPMHTEPEVSLLVYGRPLVNQIEVVRALALSAPADMLVVVKEHPWMVGKRTLNAYRKLLDIPRVRLAGPALTARELVEHAALVAVVTGSVALEAAILGKPVVTFGDCPYNALPATMVQRCAVFRDLPALLAAMVADYHIDEAALEAYVAATYDTSASVNLYSVLLQKRGVYAERQASAHEEIDCLADHLVNRLERPPAAAVGPTGAAAW